MTPGTHNYERVEGDHLVDRIRLIQPSGTAVDLTGITAAAFRIAVDHSTAAAWSATLGDGITVSDPTTGIIDVSKSLAGLAVGEYVYDLETIVGGVKETILRGAFSVLEGVEA